MHVVWRLLCALALFFVYSISPAAEQSGDEDVLTHADLMEDADQVPEGRPILGRTPAIIRRGVVHGLDLLGEFGAEEADEPGSMGRRAAAYGFALEKGDFDAFSREVIGDGAAYDSSANNDYVSFFCHV